MLGHAQFVLRFYIQIRKARDKLNQQIEAHKVTLRDNEERNTTFLYEKAKVIYLYSTNKPGMGT